MATAEWQSYTYRFPYKDMSTHRHGYNRQVHAHALQLSVLMATPPRFLRYFHAEVVRDGQTYSLHPTKMTRYIWKETVEDMHQVNYDPVLAEILPSYRLSLATQEGGKSKPVVHRKVSNDALRYPRFLFYEPIQKPGRDDTVDVSATNGLGALKSRGLHPALVFFARSLFREVFTLIDPFN